MPPVPLALSRCGALTKSLQRFRAQHFASYPVASVNGILRGSFYVTIAESTIITCSGGKGKESYRAVIEYKEESWLGRAHFLVEGVIHTYDEDSTEHEEWTKVKHIPHSRIVAFFDGCWRNRIRWRRNDSSSSALVSSMGEFHTLVDLEKLQVVPKVVRPLEKQLPRESRRLWENVTSKLHAKEYGDATKHKQTIEQQQRDEASERKRKGEVFIPAYFDWDFISGIPELTEEGRKAVEEELRDCTSNSGV